MTVEIIPSPGYSEILRVTERMRADDQMEIYATRWTNSPEDFAAEVARCNQFCWCAALDGAPVSIWGATPIWPRVWSVFAFGTPDWGRVVLTMTKHVRRSMIPGLINAGAHRVSCASHAQHTEAHTWLESLMGKREPREGHPGYGKDGERFFTYVWEPRVAHEELSKPRRSRECATPPQ